MLYGGYAWCLCLPMAILWLAAESRNKMGRHPGFNDAQQKTNCDEHHVISAMSYVDGLVQLPVK